MPLRDDLLNPIPGENPSGESLRYAPVFDKIKEARRADDDAPQGEWNFERKTADYPLVIKLAGEALATKSKDLQLAAWLTEAILRKEGFAGLKAGLELIKGLVENFWDTLYPELDDGDAEMRAAPLEWLGTRMDSALRSVALTGKGANWFQFKESRTVGYEATADTEAKVAARSAAIAEGKTTGEAWDGAVAATPKVFYAEMEETLDGILEVIESLSAVGEEKFGDVAPSFGPMRTTVEEIRHTVHGLLQKKREVEPDEGAEAAAAEEEPAGEEETPATRSPAPPKTRTGTLAAEPVDQDDAFQRVTAVAAYLRRNDPSSPLPYLLLRGLRWGELRGAGTGVDANLLDAPPTGARQAIKKAAKRLKLTRGYSGQLLGAKALVALDWNTGLVLAMHAHPDGEAHEVRFVPELLPAVRQRVAGPRLWLADRAFCDLEQPRRFTAQAGDHFLVRYHPKVKFYPDPEKPERRGNTAQGQSYLEQWGWLGGPSDQRRRYVRRIRLLRPQDDLILVTDLLDAETPEELVDRLNEYFTAMTDEIFKFDGMLDKYEGSTIPYWKTETVEAMDAFRFKPGYGTGAGECVSLAALYAVWTSDSATLAAVCVSA